MSKRTHRKFSPVSLVVFWPCCLFPARPASLVPGTCHGVQIHHKTGWGWLVVWVPKQPALDLLLHRLGRLTRRV